MCLSQWSRRRVVKELMTFDTLAHFTERKGERTHSGQTGLFSGTGSRAKALLLFVRTPLFAGQQSDNFNRIRGTQEGGA